MREAHVSYHLQRKERAPQALAGGNDDDQTLSHEVHVSTLILHGRRDKNAPLELAEEMHRGIKDSQMLTFPGGHLFFLLRPQPFLEAITNFLDR